MNRDMRKHAVESVLLTWVTDIFERHLGFLGNPYVRAELKTRNFELVFRGISFEKNRESPCELSSLMNAKRASAR